MADWQRFGNCWRKNEVCDISWKQLCNNNAIKTASLLCRPHEVLFFVALCLLGVTDALLLVIRNISMHRPTFFSL